MSLIEKFDRVRNAAYQNDDHEYFGINYVNNTGTLQEAKFTTSFNKALIFKPEEYHLNVQSFTLSANAIPIFTFKDDTYYTSLTYNGTTVTNPVVFIPFVNPSLNIANNKDIFVYQQFLDMINAAYLTTYNQLVVLQPNVAVITNQAPYYIFNPVTQLFSLIADGLGYVFTGTGNDPTTVNIYVNEALLNFFENFLYYFNSYIGPLGTQIVIKDIRNGNVSGSVYTMTQDSPSVVLWSDITRIVLVAPTLGTNAQATMTLDDKGNIVYISIIASYFPNALAGFLNRGYVNYNPFTEYYVDIQKNTPITSIQLQFFYYTKDLKLIPVQIFPNESFNIVLMFKHKSVIT